MDRYTAGHLGRLATVLPEMQAKWAALEARMAAHGHRIMVAADGAHRTAADQRRLYAIGRTFVRGLWRVADPARVVTNVLEPADGAHPRKAALDAAFVRDGRYTQDEACPWALYADEARAIGLECGADWKRPDRPHVALPNWRELPVLP